MAKVNAKVSRSLQETVAENPHIDQVHFDGDGNHYFNVHEHDGADFVGTDGKKVKSEVKGLYARIQINNVVDNNGRKYDFRIPIVKTKIVESVDREDILAADAVSDMELSQALIATLTPDMQNSIKAIISGSSKPTATKAKATKDAE